jgi:uncharacterized membrane protein
MPAVFQEWLNLIVRWVHVIAAIMWIGDSFLFMWMDSHLSKPTKPREGEVVGELWMTHSGGFYEVVKRKSLRQNELPENLYWFKWESYTTWLSGFLLLVIVYHLNGAALLTDASVALLQPWQAVAISVGILPIAYGVYELLWKTPLAKDQRVFGLVGLGLIIALCWGLTLIFSARGAFLQVGATLGTIMAANVFFRIIPGQKHMLAMTRAGQPVDTSHGLRAKGRSIQNHYLTLPVLFTMLSNHFPTTYGHPQPWWILGLLVIVGVGMKYGMNRRRETPPWAIAGTVAALATVIFLTRPVSTADAAGQLYANRGTVHFATVKAIVDARCVTCHAQKPSSPMFPAPPLGITLDSPENIRRHAERIFVRAVATKTMPLGNMTGMSVDERDFLGAWFAQGANIQAEGDSQLTVVTGPTFTDLSTMDAGAQDKAQAYFNMVCIACHGPRGEGNGPSAAMLTTHPRNFTSKDWQKSVTDQHIRKIILEGGASVGRSDIMPANPTLATEPEVLDGLVKMVRGFGDDT